MKYNQDFYIEPYVHINCQKGQALLYNTYTNDLFISNNKELIDRLNKFKEHKNAIFPVSESIYDLVNQLRERFFGDFLICSKDEIPLIIPGDLFKVVKNKDFIVNPEQRSTGNVMSHNLFCLDIYLNNSKDETDEINNQCLLLNNISELLIKEKIQILFKTLDAYKNLETINFFISEVENLEFLLSILLYVKDKYEINLTIRPQIINDIDSKHLNLFSNIYLLIQAQEVDIIKSLNRLVDIENLVIRILVETELDINMLDNQNIDSFELELIPYYNRNNISFFEQFVYINNESLFEEKINKQIIIKNSILNESDFGRLIITSNGLVYTNLFCNPLGDLQKEDFNLILQMVYNSTNSSWFSIRKEVPVCMDCIFNALCPPIANFERLFKKNNLCYIAKSD
jgi:pseudo-rSAM protein